MLWYDLFLGKWILVRTVSSPAICMRGCVTFTQVEHDSLLYKEQGSYMFQDFNYNFHQEWIFKYVSDKLQILTSNGDILHEFMTDQEVSFPCLLKHQYKCFDDTYAVQFFLHSSKFYSTIYQITNCQNPMGKNYMISSELFKVNTI